VRRRLAAIFLAGLAPTESGAAAGMAVKEPPPRRSTELPRPLHPDVAVRQELAVARRAGTLAAYDLFIQRHPEHRLADIARRERAAIAARSN